MGWKMKTQQVIWTIINWPVDAMANFVLWLERPIKPAAAERPQITIQVDETITDKEKSIIQAAIDVVAQHNWELKIEPTKETKHEH